MDRTSQDLTKFACRQCTTTKRDSQQTMIFLPCSIQNYYLSLILSSLPDFCTGLVLISSFPVSLLERRYCMQGKFQCHLCNTFILCSFYIISLQNCSQCSNCFTGETTWEALPIYSSVRIAWDHCHEINLSYYKERTWRYRGTKSYD